MHSSAVRLSCQRPCQPARNRSVQPRGFAPAQRSCAPSAHSTTSRHVFCRASEEPINSTEASGAATNADLVALLQVLPEEVRAPLEGSKQLENLLEIVLDLGRKPQARFRDSVTDLSERVITRDDLTAAVERVGEFGPDNRAGIEGTLHRISAIRNRQGAVVGLTCRVGRAISGPVEMVSDLLDQPELKSLLFLGRPGIGKTTVIRDIASTLADRFQKRVVIVDTSNEIGGDGDVPHPAIGGSRRMQVARERDQAAVMIEAVENHMPEVIVVDEIGTEAEALACRTIAERGVTLIATAHGQSLENLMNNPLLSDLVGGLESVTLGDDTARSRNCQKAVLERRGPSTFPVVIEMRERHAWVQHESEESVDALLLGDVPSVQVRRMDPETGAVFNHITEFHDLAHEETSPQQSATSGRSGSQKLPAGAVPVASGSRFTHSPASDPSVPSAAALSYDALADALNEQYSTSLPAGDLDDWATESSDKKVLAGSAGAVDWYGELDDVSVLSAMSSRMRSGGTRNSVGKGRRGGAAAAKRGGKGSR